MVVSAPRKKSVCSMQVNDKMRFIGKILFLMMLGMNVIAAFLLLLSAYSPHINPLLHPVWSCLVFSRVFVGQLLFFVVLVGISSILCLVPDFNFSSLLGYGTGLFPD